MDSIALQILVFVAVSTAAAAGLVVLTQRATAHSTIRMLRMMTIIGVDPGFALEVNQRSGRLSRAIRRCHRCPHPRLCEDWLAGKVKGGNVFCPNAGMFRGLVKLAGADIK